MSTIVSSFVKDRASAVQLPTASLIEGAAKAWCNYNGTAASGTSMAGVNASFNISSLTDAAVGYQYSTMTTPFDSNYFATGGSSHRAGVSWMLAAVAQNNNNGIALTSSNVATPGTAADGTAVTSFGIGRLA